MWIRNCFVVWDFSENFATVGVNRHKQITLPTHYCISMLSPHQPGRSNWTNSRNSWEKSITIEFSSFSWEFEAEVKDCCQTRNSIIPWIMTCRRRESQRYWVHSFETWWMKVLCSWTHLFNHSIFQLFNTFPRTAGPSDPNKCELRNSLSGWCHDPSILTIPLSKKQMDSCVPVSYVQDCSCQRMNNI